MNWTNDERTILFDLWGQSHGEADDVIALASKAVTIMAERGGTMTAEAVSHALEFVSRPGNGREAQQLGQHIAAQGAKVVDLTRWLADLTEVLCGERPVGVMPSTTLDAAKALKTRVSALEADRERLTEALNHRERRWASASSEASALRERVTALEADAEALQATIRLDREHDALLLAELGGSGETLRGAILRVKRERDDARAEVEEWKRGSWISYHEHKALQAELAQYREATPHDQETVDQLRADVKRLTREREEALDRAARAELSRLKPSGEVAEDVRLLEAEIPHREFRDRGNFEAPHPAALSRLAALAQRTQDAEAHAKMAGEDQDRLSTALRSAEAQIDEAWKAAAVPVRGVVDLAEVIAQLRSTRDEAASQFSAIRERAKDWGGIKSAAEEHIYRYDAVYYALRYVLGGPLDPVADEPSKEPVP